MKMGIDDFRTMDKYASFLSEINLAADDLKHLLEYLANDISISTHLIESRGKEYSSYKAKATKMRDGVRKYSEPFTQITDAVAARVITFTNRDRDNLLTSILAKFKILEDNGARYRNPGDSKKNGYDSVHILIEGIEDREMEKFGPNLVAYFENFPAAEIQLRTVAGHAWAEYEHDISYKSKRFNSLTDEDQDKIRTRFKEAGLLRQAMDSIFDGISNELSSMKPAAVHEVIADSDAESGTEHSAQKKLTLSSLQADAILNLVKERYPEDEVGSTSYAQLLVERLKKMGNLTDSSKPRTDDSILKEINDGFEDQSEIDLLMDYPNSVSGLRKFDDELLKLFRDDYVNAAKESGHDDVVLSSRLDRLGGKRKIYHIEATGSSEGVKDSEQIKSDCNEVGTLMGATMLKFVLGILIKLDGTDNVVVPGIIEKEPNKVWGREDGATKYKGVYLTHQLQRVNVEKAIKALVSRLNEKYRLGLKVYRAGDLIAS